MLRVYLVSQLINSTVVAARIQVHGWAGGTLLGRLDDEDITLRGRGILGTLQQFLLLGSAVRGLAELALVWVGDKIVAKFGFGLGIMVDERGVTAQVGAIACEVVDALVLPLS